jgi:hypothetical protein
MEQKPFDKLAVAQLFKKYQAFYVNCKFITAFTKAHHWALY